jgi:biopolymer transport protein ExbD
MAMAAGPVVEGEPIVDINTTPLIDVMLVLLIMLIVTLPPRRDQIPLDMPPPQPPQDQPEKPVEINVFVQEDGTILWGNEPVDEATLNAKMAEAFERIRPEPQVMVIPQRLARYRYVAQVMAAAQRNGLVKLGVRNPA